MPSVATESDSLVIGKLPDGWYLTYPTYGPNMAVRVLEVKGGAVVIEDHRFSQEIFFDVNTLIRSVERNPREE